MSIVELTELRTSDFATVGYPGLAQELKDALAVYTESGGTGETAIDQEDGEKRNSNDQMNQASRQIISRAVASDEVVNILAAASLKKPDISILSDESGFPSPPRV